MDVRLDSKIATEVCYTICKHMVHRRQIGAAGARPQTFSSEAYVDWRNEQLGTQFDQSFRRESLRGNDVLDFGCGIGQLSFLAAGAGARRVLGVDLDGPCIDCARKRVAELRGRLPVEPEFVLGTRTDVIDAPTDSFDILFCFDVLEHVMEIEPILEEWRRVLRPGGRVLIWWCPWFHPYGAHIESLVPLPWAHAIFTERTLIETCARLYDDPDYMPRIWDLDPSGKRRPNKWKDMNELPEVNRLTIRGFERLLPKVGFRIERRQISGFGSRLARITNPLTRVPVAQEFFTASVVYELVR